MEKLDLYLIHSPTLIENGDFESAWLEFERFKQEELTKCVEFFHGFSRWLFLSSSYCSRSIGVSNFTLENLQKLLKTAHVKPAVNQVTPLFTADHYDSIASWFSYCNRLSFTHTIMPKMYLFWNTILNMALSLGLMESFRSYFTCSFLIWNLVNIL